MILVVHREPCGWSSGKKSGTSPTMTAALQYPLAFWWNTITSPADNLWDRGAGRVSSGRHKLCELVNLFTQEMRARNCLRISSVMRFLLWCVGDTTRADCRPRSFRCTLAERDIGPLRPLRESSQGYPGDEPVFNAAFAQVFDSEPCSDPSALDLLTSAGMMPAFFEQPQSAPRSTYPCWRRSPERHYARA